MQDIFAAHFDSYAAARSLHPRELRAAWCIRHCYTATVGSHAMVCPEGHFLHLQYHACRHRSCPRCADQPRQLWVASQLQRLLPCPHVHIVFTLPHVLLPLWSFNRSAMASLLFDCVRDTLLELMTDPKRLGVCAGLIMALHTWGRTLSRHPHVHCLLTAGGIDSAGLWKGGNSKFLLPLKPLQLLFRGKFLARLRCALIASHLRLPPEQPPAHWHSCIRQLHRAHWNIEIEPPYDHARGLALYLARYVKGGPLPNDRTLSIDSNDLVRFDYTDHRDGRRKTLCLHAHAFIARVLWHAPPAGLRTVRYAGLYSSPHREQYRLARRHLAPEPMPALASPVASHHLQPSPSPSPCLSPAPLIQPQLCPHCRTPLVRQFQPRTVHHRGDNSKATTVFPPPTCAHPGPTSRSTGPPTAGRASAHRYSACARPSVEGRLSKR